MGDEDSEEAFHSQLVQEMEEQQRLANIKTRVDDDGTVMEWDEEKHAWFPKIDDDFLARYQMSYGTDPNTELYRQRCQQWADYYASMEKAKQDAKNAEAGGTSEENAGETGNSATSQEELMREYYDSPAYRAWYAEYMATMKEQEAGQTESSSTPNAPGATPDAPSDTSTPAQPADNSNDATPRTGKKRKAPQKPPEWYNIDDSRNTHVYVSGLPLDITETEFEEIMKKCGLIMNEPFSQKKRLKLYRDAEGKPLGDGRCCYIKVESVELALSILDGMELRGNTLHVERAKFQLKGEFDPNKRRRLTQKEKKKLKEHQENLFRWAPDANRFVRGKRERTLVLKKVFTPQNILKDPTNVLRIREKVQSECENCGVVKRVNIYENNPEGVVTVQFATPEEADVALTYLNRRVLWVHSAAEPAAASLTAMPLEVSVWDGKTRFDVEESEEMRAERLARWNAMLTGDQTEDAAAGETPSVSIPLEVVLGLTSTSGNSETVMEQTTTEEEDGAATPPDLQGDSPDEDEASDNVEDEEGSPPSRPSFY